MRLISSVMLLSCLRAGVHGFAGSATPSAGRWAGTVAPQLRAQAACRMSSGGLEDDGKLSGKSLRALRALAGRMKASKSLKTLVLGGSGVTDTFKDELERSLDAHELVNVRMGALVEGKREAKVLVAGMAEDLRGETHVVQVLGKTALLYRENPRKKPRERIDVEALIRDRGAQGGGLGG